jgi:hypothetical protein
MRVPVLTIAMIMHGTAVALNWMLHRPWSVALLGAIVYTTVRTK